MSSTSSATPTPSASRNWRRRWWYVVTGGLFAVVINLAPVSPFLSHRRRASPARPSAGGKSKRRPRARRRRTRRRIMPALTLQPSTWRSCSRSLATWRSSSTTAAAAAPLVLSLCRRRALRPAATTSLSLQTADRRRMARCARGRGRRGEAGLRDCCGEAHGLIILLVAPNSWS